MLENPICLCLGSRIEMSEGERRGDTLASHPPHSDILHHIKQTRALTTTKLLEAYRKSRVRVMLTSPPTPPKRFK